MPSPRVFAGPDAWGKPYRCSELSFMPVCRPVERAALRRWLDVFAWPGDEPRTPEPGVRATLLGRKAEVWIE